MWRVTAEGFLALVVENVHAQGRVLRASDPC
jgi:hypothetical protein